MLWTIGGALSFTIGGIQVYIPGFLVIAAVIYAVVASGSMVVIGRRFVAVSEDKNQSEAELRYVLTRLRENGESIALIQGEEEEQAGRSLAGESATYLARHLLPEYEDDDRLADERLHRACAAHYFMRAQVS